MIKLKIKQLRDQRFIQLVNNIYKSKMGVRSAQHILKVAKAIDKEITDANTLFDKLAVEHLNPIKDKPGMFEIKEGEEHKKAMDEFAEAPVEINMPRISAQDLFHVELSAADIELLEGLLDVEQG